MLSNEQVTKIQAAIQAIETAEEVSICHTFLTDAKILLQEVLGEDQSDQYLDIEAKIFDESDFDEG